MFDWPLPGTRRIVLAEDDPAQWAVDIDDAEAPPDATGLSSEALERIWAGVCDVYRTRVHPAVIFCLRHRGRIVLNRALGHAQGHVPERRPAEDARPAEIDTPVCLFSASKAVIAVLTHKLAEEKTIDLDSPVSRYLPAFAEHGKHRITIADVLAHRGGFACFPRGDGDPAILSDWPACIERICRAPATNSGGPAYHAMTGGYVLGEIIRRVTGDSLASYLDSRLRKPLGMRYFTYGLDGRSRSRVAHNHVAGMPVRWPVSRWAETALALPFEDVVALSNRDLFMDAVIPSGNLYATADELTRFYQMLLDDGRFGDTQVLARSTVARARAAVGPTRIDRMLKVPMRYSEGFMLGAWPWGMYGPATAQAYGHLGFMNILGWADPQRGLSCALLTTGKAVLGGHLSALATLLARIAHGPMRG